MSLNIDALAKLNPTRSSFYLSAIDKTIYLSPCTLGKILELHRKHGSIELLLSKENLANVPKVAFDIMEPESRVLFKTREIETTDDEGNLITEKTGGFKLFEMSIGGLAEIENMLFAIIKSFGGSETKDDVKKKIEQAEMFLP